MATGTTREEPARAADTGTPLLALEQVTKRFGGQVAVDAVDFDLRAGEVHALVGENGAGKSTLVKIADGYHRPDDGRVKVEGREVTFHSVRDAERAGIAMIPQELDLFPELTVAENLFVGRPRPRRAWRGLDWAAMRAQARERFEQLGVEIDVGAPVRELSTASRQLVAIARALAGDARVVIMDEPTSSLTDQEAQRLFAIIDDLKGEGVGVVYISHRLEEVFRLADRITVMRDGEHVETRAADDLDAEALVQLMVGRPLKELFTREGGEPGDVALEVEGLTRHGEFEDITLSVRRGEVVALAGLIGAGRTELAQTIFGARVADAGEVRVDGKAVTPRSPHAGLAHGIAYVPEDRKEDGLVLPFPVERNVTLGVLDRLSSRLGFVRQGRERSQVEELTEALEIRGAGPAAPASSLSGGNQQKVVLAKALIQEPPVLLLDEPTRGVDIGAKSEIYALIDRLAQEGRAVLVISSELEEVLALADRVLVMREGRLAAELRRDEADQEKIMQAATGVAA